MKKMSVILGAMLIGALSIGFAAAAQDNRMESPGLIEPPNGRLLPAPAGLLATPQGRGVLLQWKPVQSSEGYRIYWEMDGPVSRSSPRLDDLTPGQVRCQVGDLVPGVLYNFRVCTLRSSQEGPFSRQVGAVPGKETETGPSDSAP